MTFESPKHSIPTHFPAWLAWSVMGLSCTPFLFQALGLNVGSGNGTARSNSLTHTILEWTALYTAIFTMALALLHVSLTRQVMIPIMGVAVLGASGLEFLFGPGSISPDSSNASSSAVVLFGVIVIGVVAVFARWYHQESGPFSFSLLLSLIPHMMAYLLRAFGSTAAFDSHSHMAHVLTIFAYLIPFVGMVFEFRYAFYGIGVEDEERRQAEKRLGIQYGIVSSLATSTSLREATPKMLEIVCTELEWKCGAMWRVDEELNELYCVEVWYGGDAQIAEFSEQSRLAKFHPGIGLPGRTWQENRAVWIPDVVTDPNFPRAQLADQADLHGAFAFPMHSGERVYGVVEFYSQQVEEPDRKLLEMMAAWGLQIGQFAQKRQAQKKVLEAAQDLEMSNKELAEARDQALEAARLKTEFLATMSHEIRTPMNGVIGMTGLLLDTKLDVHQQELAETVRSSGQALLTIINDILDFSKIEAGKLEIEVIDFDIRTMMEHVLDLLAEKAHGKGLELVGMVAPDIPHVLQGDPGRIRQVLTNILGNAVKFTAEGEVVVRIHQVSAHEDQVVLQFEVEDTGIGIAPEAHDRMFQSFTQADGSTSRKFGGTGLGLAISKQLVELMGGELGFSSELGAGSHFWFSLPLACPRDNQVDSRGAREQLQGLHLCCVDDHGATLKVLAQFASTWGMRVAVAIGGEEAVTLIRSSVEQQDPFDVIVCDLNASNRISGELARQVQEYSRLVIPHLLVLTSFGRRGDVSHEGEMGFAGYLSKPIHEDKLYQGLCTVMGYEVERQLGTVSQGTQGAMSDDMVDAERQSRLKILVAEDNMVNQKVAMLMLEKLGYRADFVANGQEVVDALVRVPYDLVLMDCQMPEMDGFEATRQIRRREASLVAGRSSLENNEIRDISDQRPATSNQFRETSDRRRLPIIALTANAMKDDQIKCCEAGMDDFISKPIKLENLQKVLRHWLLKSHPVMSLDCSESCPSPMLENEGGTRVEEICVLDEATMSELRDLSEDEPNFLPDLIQEFFTRAASLLDTIQLAMDQADFPALTNAAHTLKGSAKNIGAMRLGERCSELEKMGRQNLSKQIPGAVEAVRMELTQAEAALQREIPGLLTHRQ